MRHFAPYNAKTFLILLFLSIGTFSMYGQVQDSVSDRFKFLIEKAASDSVKIPFQIQLAEHLINSDIKSSRRLLNQVEDILNSKEKNSYYQKQRTKQLQTLALGYELEGNFLRGLNSIQQAIDISMSTEDSLNLAQSYRIRSSLSVKDKDTVQAITYLRKSLTIQKKIKDSIGMARCYLEMGVLLFYNTQKKDSSMYYFEQSKKYNNSLENLINVDANLGGFYLYDAKYDEAALIFEGLVAPHKKLKNYTGLSHCYANLGNIYAFLKKQDKSLQAMDSAIAYSKITRNKSALLYQYASRRNINKYFGDYKAAFKDFELYKVYYDSINDTDQVKRFTELELNYKFEKEKEIADIHLKNESAKKRLYFILLFVVALLALVSIYFILRGKKQKIALKEMERIKTDLALANRENELKRVVIEHSITEEVLNKTLDDIKEIVTYQDETERKKALKSLSLSLISEKTKQTSTSNLQAYLDKVAMDFKIHLDQNFQEFSAKEKELIHLLKLGLTSNEIGKVLNTSTASIKSTRYRIRKKLGIDPATDIIAYIEKVV